jgi:hypothetical protein
MAVFLRTEGFVYDREFHVDFRCVEVQNDKFALVDFKLVLNGVIVVIENDENQHNNIPTSCDVKRMMEIYESWAVGGNTMPIAFVRFNPHAYHVDSTSPRRALRVPLPERHAHLAQVLRDPDHELFDKARPFKILHMYYDTCNGVPTVVGEYGYLNSCVIPCIID